ncbi:MAG TPA: hypothetical protein VFY52_07760, partial [Thermoleophilaceae bacterium]|nr:hypothetical protein [Thermoleophilaceae bacterium]
GRAIDLLAYEEAVRLYELAFKALGPQSAATARRRCELLLALANAKGRAGDSPGAKASFLEAAELARSAGLPEALGRAAVGYGGRFLWDRAMSDERLVPLLQDALAALGDVDSTLRVQLLSRLSAALRGEPSREHRERISEEAVETARRIGDPAAVAYALDAAEAALHAPHNAQVRLDEAREIVSLATATGDRERLFDGHEHAFWAAWELGDPGVREVELRSMAHAGEQLRQPAQLWILTVTRATLALAEGRFAEVERLIEEAATVGERAQSRTAAAVAHTLPLFLLRREQGRLAESERQILGPGHEFSGPLVRGSVLAHIHARLERTDEARAALDELMSRDLSDWHLDEEWLLGICLLAETCVLLEDAEHAAPLYQLLLPYASLNAIAVPQLALGSTSRPLGMLAALLSRLEAAERHFEEALRMDERMGARPWLAHTQEEFGRMLLRRDNGEDRERAEQLQSQADAAYRELGMRV